MAVPKRNLPATLPVQGEVIDQQPVLLAEAQIKEALREGKTALWKLAEGFWTFNDQQGWSVLGYASLSAWLEDPEIDTTRGTFYRLVRTWQKLAIEKGVTRDQLEGVDMSKAALVADTVAEGDVRPTTALKDVRQLPASALRQKYGKPARGRPPKAQATGHHSSSTALRAAGDLPWGWVEEALSKRTSLDLREARLREALRAFLTWRDEFLG